MKSFLQRFDKILILSFLLVCASVYAFISIMVHEHFLTFGWDLGFFDQLIWKLSRFIYPLSSLNKVNILANHFSPILFFYAPLYWIWSNPRVLIIAQSLVMVFAAWPLYLLALHKTKSKLFSFAVVFSYLFFLGTQWSILNEFHELTVAPLFIVLVFYGIEKKKNLLFWVGIVGLLMTKEEMSLLVSALGLTVAFFFGKRRLGLILSIFSFVFFLFLVFIFMPSISEKGTYQHSHLSQTAKTPLAFTQKLFTDPYFVLTSLVTPPEKIKTFVSSFFSFGLLPIVSPPGVLVPLSEQFLMRFLYSGGQFTTWVNVNHHAAPSAMLLPIASLYAVLNLAKKKAGQKKRLIILSLVLFSATILQDIAFKAPVHSLLKKQFYETLTFMEDNRAILTEIRKLSPGGPIAVQNSLYPHLSQRRNIYLLPEINDAEYLVLDFHNGPNKYAPLQYDEMFRFVNKLIADGEFAVYKKQGEALILVRSQ